MASFSDLINQRILRFEATQGEAQVRVLLGDGRVFVMLHHQDCSEGVHLDDICGDLRDLQDAMVLDAREEINPDFAKEIARDFDDESHTWTFYILATDKGTVTLRWLGTSNGHYSESVSFEEGQPTFEELTHIRAMKMQRDTGPAAGSVMTSRL